VITRSSSKTVLQKWWIWTIHQVGLKTKNSNLNERKLQLVNPSKCHRFHHSTHRLQMLNEHRLTRNHWGNPKKRNLMEFQKVSLEVQHQRSCFSTRALHTSSAAEQHGDYWLPLRFLFPVLIASLHNQVNTCSVTNSKSNQKKKFITKTVKKIQTPTTKKESNFRAMKQCRSMQKYEKAPKSHMSRIYTLNLHKLVIFKRFFSHLHQFFNPFTNSSKQNFKNRKNWTYQWKFTAEHSFAIAFEED